MPRTSSTFTSFQMAARYMAGYIIKNKLPIEPQMAAVLAWEQAHAALLRYYQAEEDLMCLNDALRLKVLPTFNHLAIQDFSVTPIEKIEPPSGMDEASVTVAEDVNPTRPVVPVITLPPVMNKNQRCTIECVLSLPQGLIQNIIRLRLEQS